MFYQLYEFNHAAMQPYRAIADATRLFYSSPLNPLSQTPFGRSIAGMAELFERTTRRYGKPSFGIDKAVVDWKQVAVTEKVVWSRPFCNLIHFERDLPAALAGVRGHFEHIGFTRGERRHAQANPGVLQLRLIDGGGKDGRPAR